MAITEIDRIRMHDDMDQLNELVQRKQAVWHDELDPMRKATLLEEIELHATEINALKAQLAQP